MDLAWPMAWHGFVPQFYMFLGLRGPLGYPCLIKALTYWSVKNEWVKTVNWYGIMLIATCLDIKRYLRLL